MVTRLLLVDDHPVLRAGIKTLLDVEEDLSVVAEADDGVKAVHLARETSPDVIIMDLALPLLTGSEAAREILAHNPTQRVLALSAHEDAGFVRQLLGIGVAGYALKRRAGDELVRAVRAVASGETYLDPALTRDARARRPDRPHGLPAIRLSHRETEVVRLVARGHTAKEMAERLGLSPRTLETYKVRAMAKLELRTRSDLIRYAVRAGLLRDP